MIVSVGTVEHLHKHQYVELLLQAEQRATPRRPWNSKFAPSNIRIEVRPIPPVPPNASAFLRWLQTEGQTFSLDADTNPLYQRRSDRPRSFDCVQIHTNRVRGPAGTAS